MQFVAPKSVEWDADANVMEKDAWRHADVYVFALLAHRDKATIDPLNLAQWQFWAVSTTDPDRRTRSQYSITLKLLRELAGDPVDWRGLSPAVKRAVRQPVLRAKGGG